MASKCFLCQKYLTKTYLYVCTHFFWSVGKCKDILLEDNFFAWLHSPNSQLCKWCFSACAGSGPHAIGEMSFQWTLVQPLNFAFILLMVPTGWWHWCSTKTGLVTDPDSNLLSKCQDIAKGGEKGGEAGERAQIFSQTSLAWADHKCSGLLWLSEKYSSSMGKQSI